MSNHDISPWKMTRSCDDSFHGNLSPFKNVFAQLLTCLTSHVTWGVIILSSTHSRSSDLTPIPDGTVLSRYIAAIFLCITNKRYPISRPWLRLQIWLKLQIHMLLCVNKCVCEYSVYTYICACMCIYLRVYTYIHTYACILIWVYYIDIWVIPTRTYVDHIVCDFSFIIL